ncbi:MAG: hypothetical protein P1S60_11500 [Anaerolineae bacterium]|nr:hypothetical protein [Anaerolineae bacterium]
MNKNISKKALQGMKNLSRREKTILIAILAVLFIFNLVFCYFGGIIVHNNLPH